MPTGPLPLQARYRWHIFVLFLLCLPLVMYGAKGAWDSIENRVEDWLPETFDETQRLIWYYNRFGTDELMMVSWEGCTLDDQRLKLLRDKLLATTDVDGEPTQWFHSAVTGAEALEALTGDPINLDEAQALGRLSGWLIGPDGQQTCIVALVSSAGEQDRHAAIQYVYDSADEVPGLSASQIHLAGTTRDGVAIDQASKQSLAALNLGSFAVCVLIMLIGFRSIGLTMIVFTTAIFCEQMSMAIMYFSGQPMDSVLTLASQLTYILVISAGVHLVNYYREARKELSWRAATSWAVGAAWRPCVLSAGTTAIGMMSLTISQITPVNNFGLYAAISLLAATVVLLLLVPAHLYQWNIKPPDGSRTPERERVLPRFWQGLSSMVARLKWVIVGTSATTIAVALTGVSKIETSVQLHDLFTPNAPIIRDYAWLEERVGPLIPLEIVLRVPKTVDVEIDDWLKIVAATQRAVADSTGVEATISAATFAPPPLRTRRGLRAVARRSLLRSQLPEFKKSNYYQQDGDEQLWRISARVPAGSRADYGEVTSDIRQHVETQLGKVAAIQGYESVAKVQAVYCGSVPLIFKAQREMFHDLIASFGLAFVLISLMMVLLLRSLTSGLLTMIPNVLPSLLVFGMMGWLGITVELGSMLTASAALGIAVDDSLHFITWFRRGMAQDMSRREAAIHAYRHCGAAMIQTSMICCFGLLIFSLSPFTPIARFAWLMFTLLQLALLCDLIVLPAVLMCFTPKMRSSRVKRPVLATPESRDVFSQ